MKQTALTILVLIAASNSFAAGKDLKMFNALLRVGAQTEFFMSKAHLGLDNIECAYSMISKTYDCSMDDIAANEGEGAKLFLEGKDAKVVFQILERANAPMDNGMGKVFISAASIRCSQVVRDVAGGSDADRTGCSIELAAE